MYYEKNVEALKSRYYDVYLKLMDLKDNHESNCVEVAFSKKGETVIIYKHNDKKFYLNSRYDSSHEAKIRMKQYGDMQDESVLFMFGMSNCSFIKEFLRITNESIKCVVYEPSVDIFLANLNNSDMTDLILSERVCLCIVGLNNDNFNKIVQDRILVYNKHSNRNMAPPRYLELFDEQYMIFKRILIDKYEHFYISTSTAISYGKSTVRNNIMNMKYLRGCRNGHDLAGKFPEDMPAIVVAAGPSLKKNLHMLEKAKGKALIIVVDTAISSVINTGVVPDMISAIDFSKPIEMFETPGTNKIPMLIGMDFNYDVLEFLHPENLFFCSSDSIIWDNLFKENGSEMFSINDGGSVATFSIAMLIRWGVKRIIMMGQDLAMTDNKEHFGDKHDIGEVDMDRYTYVPGVLGEKVLVRKDYYIYLKWIEDVARIFKEVDFIDATEGGSLKANTRAMKLSEAIEQYCNKEYDIKGIIENIDRLFNDDTIVINSLEKMKKDLKKLKRQLTEGAIECRLAKKEFERGANDIISLKHAAHTKRRLDDLIYNSDLYSYINKYMTTVEITMLQDLFNSENDDIKESIRMFEKTADYYDGISNGIPEIINMVEECIDLIKR